MESIAAIKALAALAQEHRLAVFRLLVRRGPGGLPAGEIARTIGISASAMSFHLAQLEHARLVRSWRRHRRIYYAVEIDAVRRLLAFLTQDCCQGRPELCGDIASLPEVCAAEEAGS